MAAAEHPPPLLPLAHVQALLSALLRRGKHPGQRGGFGHAGLWSEALDALHAARARGLSPSAFCYSAAIAACGKAGQLSLQVTLRRHRGVRQRQPGAAAAAAAQQMVYGVRLILSVVHEIFIAAACGKACRSSCPLPYTAMLQPEYIAASRPKPHSQLQPCLTPLLRAAARFALTLLCCHGAATLSVCSRLQWERAVLLLHAMEAHQSLHAPASAVIAWADGLAPDGVCYNAAIAAVARSGQWRAALSLLEVMRQEGLTPTTVSFNAAITACARGGRADVALSLLAQMRGATAAAATAAAAAAAAVTPSECANAASPVPDVDSGIIGVPAAVAVAAATASEGAPALPPLGAESGDSDGAAAAAAATAPVADVVSFTAAIGACGDAGRWQDALRLLRDMRADGVRPNWITYRVTMGALAKAGKWRQQLDLYDEMNQEGTVNSQ
ncbi:hypothetical protein JKP88DRAFT_302516 [Tribonema minus]|uniref:Pentatricopeptide repeat-containing protein n=1 Tax=Tribonema minus TaxID=303371 RepID=A0A835ZBP2_9STRA|nr:hypothetical protein JKP88DRAFT_302516 [Tribonema minus]